MDESNVAYSEWSTREYREGDEEQILELRGIALSGARDKQWWKWMNLDGPAGPAFIAVAEAKQKIIGHHAVLPVRIKIKDQVTRGGHGFDLMVHPDYRRQGVFVKLVQTLNQSPKVKGRSISYGTPNDQSRPGFIKRLSVLEYFQVPVLVKVVDWGYVLKDRYRIPVLAGNLLGNVWERIARTSPPRNTDVEVEQVSAFDERIDKFWHEASSIKKIMVVKDMKYLNWRYVAKPGNEYKIFWVKRQGEIAGFTVLKCEKGTPNRGFIIDLLALPGEDAVAKALIARAVAYLKAEGAVTISCLMLQDAPYYRTLRKMGFVRRSGRGLTGRIFDQNIPKEFVTDPSNWYYVMGDGDAI